MSAMCGCLALLIILVGAAYAIDKQSIDYYVEFALGAAFVICIYAALTI